MPPRSKVDLLPEGLREQLNQRLVASSFSSYEALEAWLEEQGFGIGKSSIQRYGAKFEDRLRSLKLASEQAKAIVAESPDDEGAMNEALVRLTQEKMFDVLQEMQVDPKEIELPKLARAIADLGRASVQQKKYASEIRDKTRAAADAAAKIARRGGMTADLVSELRAKILGIAE